MRKPIRIPKNAAEGLAMFDNESDRAAAVLAGAYLEAILDRVLRGCLITDADVERLFATASHKVHLLFALGLLDRDERDHLLKIQKVRNYFGHHVLDADFGNQTVAQLVDDAVAWWGRPPIKEPKQRRVTFLTAVVAMITLLEQRVLPDREDDTKRAEAEARHRLVNRGKRLVRVA